MKRNIIVGLLLVSMSVCQGQEWFSSFDVAKRLARVQNKMLFVMWEDSFQDTLPLFTVADNGKALVIDLSKDTSLDSIIWEYFVPVKLPNLNMSILVKQQNIEGTVISTS